MPLQTRITENKIVLQPLILMMGTSQNQRTHALLLQIGRILREPYLGRENRYWRGCPPWRNPSIIFHFGVAFLMIALFEAKTYWGWW